MKKLFIVAAFTLFGITTSNAQGVHLGANAAIPVGDADGGYGFGLALDFSYLFAVNDVFHVGPSASVLHYFGKEEDFGPITIENDDATFIPIGGEARFWLEQFFFNAHLGYGIGVAPDGNDGGFYYRPGVGYMFTESVGAAASYSGITVDGGTFSSVNFGATFRF